MRRTFRLLAAIKPSRYLEAGAPTGLTGLFSHPTPRSSLLYLYSRTLESLSEFPPTSLYRQSVEALTKHRMQIVQAVEPEGYAAWKEQVQRVLKENPEAFERPEGLDVGGIKGSMEQGVVGGKIFVKSNPQNDYDERDVEWDAEKSVSGGIEVGETARFEDPTKNVSLPEEPSLTVTQIEEIENKIGAGLIEEVIQVAEGELRLLNTMLQAKVWEDLEEKPVEGQWTYFKRDTGTPETQAPPQK